MDMIGLDLHQRESQLCILTEDGEMVELRIRTSRERLRAVLGGRPRARILLEDRKSTRLNSSHIQKSRMPSSA